VADAGALGRTRSCEAERRDNRNEEGSNGDFLGHGYFWCVVREWIVDEQRVTSGKQRMFRPGAVAAAV
jgi:hypothetical protein